MTVTVRPVTAADLEIARRLFLEYHDTPGVSAAVVGFDREVAALPDGYDVVLLAEADGAPVGCVALREWNGEAEMKRLYVRASGRGTGAGRALVLAAIAEARSRGYRLLQLDTLPSMTSAIALYDRLGFRRIPPYHHSGPPGTLYFAFDLR